MIVSFTKKVIPYEVRVQTEIHMNVYHGFLGHKRKEKRDFILELLLFI